MLMPLLLCLLLPLVFAGEIWLERGDRAGSAPIAAEAALSIGARVLLALIAALALTTSIAAIVDQAPLLFDDAFISFRYAKNFGTGVGLRWNAGEAPSEGYTNFLLVFMLAPLIRLGADPLLATRVLSSIAALGMLAVFFALARRAFHVSLGSALALTIAMVTCSTTPELTMLGLETVLFAAACFLAFALSERFFDTRDPRWMWAAGGVAFAAFLLRPEAVFVMAAIVAAALCAEWRDRSLLSALLKAVSVSFVLPVALYLGWKQLYFGSIVPNPAFVKMRGAGLLSQRGTASVRNFLYGHWKLVLLAGVGAVTTRQRLRTLLACSLIVAAYLVFYLRVDTLMDIHHRFLYPAFPFLFVMAVPATASFIQRLFVWQQLASARVATGLLLFMLVFYEDAAQALQRVTKHAIYHSGEDEVSQASHVLKNIGLAFASYEHVQRVMIGGTDAGLLPYFSGARHVDMAGLVTRFIAVHKDVDVAANYFFAQHPDVIMVRTERGGKLINYEHGVLGDYTRWSQHAGWNGYRELGGVHAGSRFDLHFFMRQGTTDEAALSELIRARLADADVARVTETLGTGS